MDRKKLRRLCEAYDSRMLDIVGVVRADPERPCRGPAAARAHVRWMLGKILDLGDDGKINRWLGFTQGAMWALGAYSINELRAHVAELLDSNGVK